MPENPYQPPKEVNEPPKEEWSPLARVSAVLVIGTGVVGLGLLGLGVVFIALEYLEASR